MGWFQLVDWPHYSDPLWSEDDLTWRERIEGRLDAWYDGSWLARMWWDVRHPPKAMFWTPPWRRHKKACEDRFRAIALGERDPAKHPLTYPPPYCGTCDSWHLTPRHPVFWLVLIFGEH